MSALLSKIIAIIMFAVSIIMPLNEGGVKAEINVSEEENQVISVFWTNETNKAIDELRFSVEKQENGEWTTVEFCDNFGFREIYTRYYPTESGTIRINCEDTFGKNLPKGQYRLILYYHLILSDKTSDMSATEFEII